MSGFSEKQTRIILDFMAGRDVPGAAVALVRDGEVVAAGGFGLADVQAGRGASASTGGIVSTAHDLARYQVASMDDGDTALGLSPASLDVMHCVQHAYGDSGWGYGLGYWVMRSGGTRVIGHSGGLPGVSTYSLMIPSQRTGVVVLTNRSDIKAMGLAELLAGDLRGPLWRESLDEPLPIHSAWAEPTAGELKPYLGRYRFRRGPAQVEPGRHGVVVRTPSRYDGPIQDIETCRVARDRFMSLADGHVIDFLRDGRDRIRGFVHAGYQYLPQA